MRGVIMQTGRKSWREVWREGLVPHLPIDGLMALERALIKDDARLLQGTTCSPSLMEDTGGREVEAACAIGYCKWRGGRTSIKDLEEFFVKTCDLADEAMGEPCAIRHFLNWYDDTPRAEMRRDLLSEVMLALETKAKINECCTTAWDSNLK